MNHKGKLLILFISVVLLVLWACVPDEFTKDYNTDILYEPSFTGPVAYGALSIEDILANADSTGMIYTDSNDLIYIAFREHLDDITAADWIKIPDQQFIQIYYDYPYDVAAATLGNPGDTIPHMISKHYPFSFGDKGQVDSVYIKHGFLRNRTRSTLKHKGILTSYSENIKKDGQPYYKETIISDASGDFTNEDLIPLDGYWVYLDNETNPDTSYLVIDFVYYMINSGEDITAGEYVSMTKSFEEIEYEVVYGSVGDYDTTLIEDEVFDFELFAGDFSGIIYFENPRFRLIVDNSVGVPIGIDLYNVSAYYASTNTTIDLEFEPGSTPFIIKAPKLNELGKTITTTIQVDSTISNLNELTNSNISQFRFSASALTNPPGSDLTGNFVLDTSKLSVDYEIELPLNIRIEDFKLEDTVEFSLTGFNVEQMDFEINSLEIKILTTNWMPIDINLQVLMVDSAYNVLDSLFNADNTNILPSGNVVNGIVTLPSEEEVTVHVVSDNFEAVKETKYLIINATIESTDEGQTPVKLYSHYSIDFRVSLSLDAKIESTGGN